MSERERPGRGRRAGELPARRIVFRAAASEREMLDRLPEDLPAADWVRGGLSRVLGMHPSERQRMRAALGPVSLSVAVYLPGELEAQAQAVAGAEGLSLSALLRMAIVAGPVAAA